MIMRAIYTNRIQDTKFSISLAALDIQSACLLCVKTVSYISFKRGEQEFNINCIIMN